MRKQHVIPQTTKDPEEAWPYGWNWTDALEDGDTIATSAWSITGKEDPVDLDVDPGSDVIDNVNFKTTVRLTGGTSGVVYILKNIITTTLGDTGVRRMEIRLQPK